MAKIYALIRVKKGVDSKERLKKMLEDPVSQIIFGLDMKKFNP